MAKLDRRVVAVWRWTFAFWGTCLTLAAGVAAWLFRDLTALWILPGPLLLGGTALIASFRPTQMWKHWSYELGEEALELSHGAWFQEHSVVPWSRVQHVDISHGPLDRRYGLAQLKIHTASAKTDAKLPGIEAGEAERLRMDILDRYQRAIGST